MREKSQSFGFNVIFVLATFLLGTPIVYYSYIEYQNEFQVQLETKQGRLYQWYRDKGDLTLILEEDTNIHYRAYSHELVEFNWDPIEHFDFNKDTIQLKVHNTSIYRVQVNHIVCISEKNVQDAKLSNLALGLGLGIFLLLVGLGIFINHIWSVKVNLPRINAMSDEDYKQVLIRREVIYIKFILVLFFLLPYLLGVLMLYIAFLEQGLVITVREQIIKHTLFNEEVTIYHFLVVGLLMVLEIVGYFLFNRVVNQAYGFDDELKSLTFLSRNFFWPYLYLYFKVVFVILIILLFQSNGFVFGFLMFFSLYKLLTVWYQLMLHIARLRLPGPQR
ncbi:MAG: hypothetical protein MUF42_08055 [Cytophagaceae bacterium]|jgi:hypothetical protein|nr:hypothetical protein [Cytophagaceae bacterium]